MLNRIPAFFSRLRHSTSGHATLLTALSMPMLIGGAGLVSICPNGICGSANSSSQ